MFLRLLIKLLISPPWNDVTEPDDDSEPLEYISVKLEDPYLDKPINAALFHRDDGADLVWSRPKPKNSSE